MVQQDYAPVLGGAHSGLASWLAQVDKLEKLAARIVVPSHTAVTDRRAFADMRGTLVFVRDRWAAIRSEEPNAAAAAERLVAEFKARYPASKNAEMLRMSAGRL